VRVRWDREQLIGGKPERLVSRALRVLIWVPDQRNTRIDGGAGLNCYCGIDWAEGHHDIAIVGSDGKLVDKKRIGDDPAGFTALTGMLADAGDSPEDPIAVARPRAGCWWRLCVARGGRCSRSTRWPWPAIGSGLRWLARSPTTPMR
jgi:hypothetical protein